MREKKLKTGINKREKAILKFIEKQINKPLKRNFNAKRPVSKNGNIK